MNKLTIEQRREFAMVVFELNKTSLRNLATALNGDLLQAWEIVAQALETETLETELELFGRMLRAVKETACHATDLKLGPEVAESASSGDSGQASGRAPVLSEDKDVA